VKLPRVVYWNNQPTPYLTARLNAVVAQGKVDVQGWFDVEREPDRSWDFEPSEWDFPATVLPRARIGLCRFPLPSADLLIKPIDILITPMDRVTGAAAALVGRAIANRVASRTLPVAETWNGKRLRSEVAYRFLYRSIDGAKTSGEQAAEMAERYGLPRSRIWNVTQAVDLDLYGSATRIEKSEVAEFRREHAMHGCTFIYVGRLAKGKGVNFLIDAFRDLTNRGVDASLVVLGNGEDEDAIRAQVGAMGNVTFVGFVQPLALPPWYAAADVLVFPTLGDSNGLVVEEAMAAGLPVISTENAGDIRTRVLEGETGFVVPAFDVHALSDKMGVLALDEELRREMGIQAIESARRFSVDNYASDFAEFVEGLLSQPPRSNPCASAARVAGQALLYAARPT